MRLNTQIIEKVENQKERIGELLVKYTSLSEEQLEEALTYQRESGGLIGEILIRKNFIHPHDIVEVICHQMGIPYSHDVKIDEIDPNLIKLLSINYAKQNEVLPFAEEGQVLKVLMGDPFNFNAINDLQGLYQKEVRPIITRPLKIQEAINRVYERSNQTDIDNLEDEFEESLDLDGPIDILDSAADEAPVIRFVNSIIFRSVKEKASDIHIEPYERETVYRFRVNGVMTEILRQPKRTHSAVTARIKVMAKLDIAEKRLPQDGRIKIKIAGKDIDIRLSTTPIQNGERIVMRVLEKNNMALTLENLGFQGKILDELSSLTRKKHGVLYVTGPTGHGKTTTLFALLDRMNSPDKMIITVEDPVEYEIAGVSQIQVNSKIDLTFAVALRSILRQNPDVVMIGETRDQETAEIAINASLTGHFVLSTLHTNDASSAPTRLIDMGVQPFLISSSLVGVLAQRLIQLLCPACKEPSEISELEKTMLNISDVPVKAHVYKPKGCPKCNDRGYSGRTVVCELMLLNDEVRSLILEKSDASKIKKAAINNGMIPMKDFAMDLVWQGITSTEEVIRAINVEKAKLPEEQH